MYTFATKLFWMFQWNILGSGRKVKSLFPPKFNVTELSKGKVKQSFKIRFLNSVKLLKTTITEQTEQWWAIGVSAFSSKPHLNSTLVAGNETSVSSADGGGTWSSRFPVQKWRVGHIRLRVLTAVRVAWVEEVEGFVQVVASMPGLSGPQPRCLILMLF